MYLISALVVSLALPNIEIPWFQTAAPQIFSYSPDIWTEIESPVVMTDLLILTPGKSIAWGAILGYGGMFLAMLLFCYKLYQIHSLRKNGKRTVFSDYECIVVAKSTVVFTFFKSIFLGDEVPVEKHKNILEHEFVHVRQWHSLDMLFFELLRIFCWFNPMVYWYQSRMRELHEFIADATMLEQDRGRQYELLLSEVFQTQNISFLNHFYKPSLVKRRIHMLQKNTSHKAGKMKYLLTLPLIGLMLCYTSCESEILKEDLELPFAVTSSDLQNESDEVLYERMKAKALQEIDAGGNSLVLTMEKYGRFYDDKIILTKEEFFEHLVLQKMHISNILAHFNAVDNEQPLVSFDKMAERIAQMPVPSTTAYKHYVQRKKAFQILDKNLKISLKNYGVVELYGAFKDDSNTLFKVGDTRDLTGDEVRNLNRRLAVFEQGAQGSEMILTDGERRLLIFKGEI